jgi:hypothetical protein
VSALPSAEKSPGGELAQALQTIAGRARARDQEAVPAFPEDAILLLEQAGALAFNAQPGLRRPAAAAELALVRSIAAADGSVGRIFDGHLNAVERIVVHAPRALRDRELEAARDRRMRAGVWGGDPIPGEGPPAKIVPVAGGEALRGVKTFCSGAGGLHRAVVLARDEEAGMPGAVWIDLTDEAAVEVDQSWYRGQGLRASVSHRVVFHDAPVLARLGAPGGFSAPPWFARDALRTAAHWAGMADTAVAGALRELADRPRRGQLEGLAAGRILTAQRTIGLWIDAAGGAMDVGSPGLDRFALHARAAISDACRVLLDEAARATGSRPFATGGALDRARRDLELFLLQHRLEPMLARAGEAALAER